MARRRQDSYGKRARQEGFAARSVYKLEEMDRRLGLFRPGQRVLDLGAAPGSWMQYAAKRVGPKGHVLGVDIKDCRPTLPAHAEFRQLDVRDLSVDDGEPFDVVMSDMAPATTGHRSVDQQRSFDLFMMALSIAQSRLKPGGTFLGKIFQGPSMEEARGAVAAAFGKARILRPKATRSESYETFIAGLGLREPSS